MCVGGVVEPAGPTKSFPHVYNSILRGGKKMQLSTAMNYWHLCGKADLAMTWRIRLSEQWERCVPMWSLCVECAAMHLHSNRGKFEMQSLL